jgi:hypothetical protein
MAMNDRDLFAKADQQVSTLKERIARQHIRAINRQS